MVTAGRHEPTGHLDHGSPLRSQPDYVFDFCGGHLAVDFTNTVSDRLGDPSDHLNTFGDVVAWGEACAVLSRKAATALREQAAADPDRAQHAWRKALALREALYHVLVAAASRRRPRSGDLAVVNDHVSVVFQSAALTA